jgi:hypothetical protein
MVIVELRSTAEEFLPNRIYIRHKDQPRYRPLKALQPMVSSEAVVTPLECPRLFYLSNKLSKRDQHYAGEWEGLYSFDIQTGTSVQLASRDSLSLPPPYTEGWVNDIVSVSADANQLYLRIGALRPEASAVDNQLVRMDMSTREIHFVSRLKGSFL